MTRRFCLAVLLVATMFAVQGCKSSGSSKHAPILDALESQKLGYNLRWTTSLATPPDARIQRVVALADSVVTIESPNNLVTCVSMRDGSHRWRRIVGERLETLSAPYMIGKDLCINSENKMYMLDPFNGELKSLSDLEAPVTAGPAVSNKLAIFGSDNGLVFAHNTETGFSFWRQSMPAAVLVPPVILGNNVFVTDANGNFRMFNTSGDVIWQGRALGRIAAQPALTTSGVFVPSEDQSLYALNRANGRDRWIYRAETPLKTSPVVLGTSLFQYTENHGLLSIDPLNGAKLWALPIKALPVALTGQKLLLASRDALLVVDNPSGKIITQMPVAQLQRVERAPDNGLILVSPNGRMQRLDPQ